MNLKYLFLKLFLLFVCVGMGDRISAQITLRENNVSIEDVINKIEDISDYRFLYNKKMVDVTQKVSVTVQNENINSVLNKLFDHSDIGYSIDGKQIVLNKKSASVNASQKRTVSGTVMDSAGESVIGASVIEKGTSNGVVTDVNGDFSINVGVNAVLQISYLGYATQEITVGNRTQINVTLNENTQSLDEVVVVGYGTQKKSSLTTAVASVSGDQLFNQTNSDMRKILQGLTPGLTILDNGGNPGDMNLKMQIRGISSPNGSEPLVIVDGQVQSFNNLDVATVESISILKDAASTAIYGSRGSNGIILVTTKQGEKGKMRINYDASVGWQSATSLPKFATTEQFLRYRNVIHDNEVAIKGSSSTPSYTEQEIADYLQGMKDDPYTYRAASYNMEDLYRPNRPQTRHSISLTGGNDYVRSMFNVSYFNQDGLIPNRDFNRIGFRSNNNFNISKTLGGHANIYFQHSRQRKANSHPEYEIVQGIHAPASKMLGGAPFYDKDGNYLPNGARRRNALLEADPAYMGWNIVTPDYGTIDAGLDWKPIDGLKISAYYAYQKTWSKQEINKPAFDLGFINNKINQLSYYNTYSTRSTLNGLINYDKSFRKHTVNALAGYSTEEYRYESYQMTGGEFFNNVIRNIGSGNKDYTTISNGWNDWGLRSWFGRINYNYDNKYYAEVSLRYDGSSRFPKGKKYSSFPGASVGWRISNESFWTPLGKIVNTLKLRYSYGQTGSHDGIGNYEYIPQLVVGSNYAFSTGPNGEYSVKTVRQNDMASEELNWEKVTQNNVGVDLGIFSNRLTATFDYFNKVTNDILLDVPVPALLGLNPSKTNAGKVENKGWELEIDWHDHKGDFFYYAGIGLAHVKDKLVDYAGLGITNIGMAYYRWEGSPLYAIRGYKVIGIIQTADELQNVPKIPNYATVTGPGDYIYEDLNHDGQIDWNNDAQYLGNRTPSYTFNIKLGASRKGIDFNMIWAGTAGAQTYLAGYLGEMGSYNNAPVSSFVIGNYWTKAGDTYGKVHFSRPRMSPSPYYTDNYYTSAFVWSTDYLRMKSLVLGYTLPEKFTKNLKISKLRIFYEGNNLLTISKFMSNWGLDPEDVPTPDSNVWSDWGPAGGITNSVRHIQSPQLKSYNVGINIQF